MSSLWEDALLSQRKANSGKNVGFIREITYKSLSLYSGFKFTNFLGINNRKGSISFSSSQPGMHRQAASLQI